MATSSNVQLQSSKSPFEDLDISFDPGFNEFEAFASGTKEKDGSVRINPKDIINGNVDTPDDKDDATDKKTTIADIGNEDALDDFLDDHMGAGANEDNTEDDNKNGDEAAEAKPAAATQTEGDVNYAQAYYDLMVSKGLWNAKDDFDGTEEGLDKLLNEDRENIREEEVNAFIDEAFEKNPEGKVYGKALLTHMAQGGRISDFQAVYGADDISVDDLDNEDAATAEATATALLRDYYSKTGMKPETISKTIKAKKERGLLIDTAKDFAEPWADLNQEAKAELERVTAENHAKAKTNAINYRKSVLSLVENEKVGNTVIGKTPQERKALSEYMLQPTAELPNGQKTSQLNADLAELRSNPEWNVVLAATAKAFKNKTASVPAVTTKTNTKDSIKEILAKNRTTAVQSASLETTDTPKNSTRSKAWEGLY